MKTISKLFLLLSLIIVISCNKDEDSTPPNADIIGAVSLYDDRTIPIDNAGMTISVHGASLLYSTTTDADGNYTLKNVTLGKYNLFFEKSGYGSYKIFDVDHNSADVPTNITHIPSLGQISTTEVTDLSVASADTSIIISVTTNPAGNSNNPRYVRYFFKNGNGVSSIGYSVYSDVLQINDNPHEKTYTKSDLENLGFTTGTTVWVKVYGESFYSNDYDEPFFGIRVFPNLNEISADEVSFVVP